MPKEFSKVIGDGNKEPINVPGTVTFTGTEGISNSGVGYSVPVGVLKTPEGSKMFMAGQLVGEVAGVEYGVVSELTSPAKPHNKWKNIKHKKDDIDNIEAMEMPGWHGYGGQKKDKSVKTKKTKKKIKLGYQDINNLKATQNSKFCVEKLKDNDLHKKLFVMVSDSMHLQIDMDDVEDEGEMFKRLGLLKQRIKIKGYRETESKSGNKHFIIELKEPLSAIERILIQMFLYSDPIREILSYFGTIDGNNDAILLIEKRSEWPGLENELDPYNANEPVNVDGVVDVVEVGLKYAPEKGDFIDIPNEIVESSNGTLKQDLEEQNEVFTQQEKAIKNAIVNAVPSLKTPHVTKELMVQQLTIAQEKKNAKKKWMVNQTSPKPFATPDLDATVTGDNAKKLNKGIKEAAMQYLSESMASTPPQSVNDTSLIKLIKKKPLSSLEINADVE